MSLSLLMQAIETAYSNQNAVGAVIPMSSDLCKLAHFDIISTAFTTETVWEDKFTLENFQQSTKNDEKLRLFEENKRTINNLCSDINSFVMSVPLKSSTSYTSVNGELLTPSHLVDVPRDLETMSQMQQRLASEFNNELSKCEAARVKYGKSQEKFKSKSSQSAVNDILSKQISIIRHLTKAKDIKDTFSKQCRIFIQYVMGELSRDQLINKLKSKGDIDGREANPIGTEGRPAYLETTGTSKFVPLKKLLKKPLLQRIFSSIWSA